LAQNHEHTRALVENVLAYFNKFAVCKHCKQEIGYNIVEAQEACWNTKAKHVFVDFSDQSSSGDGDV